jgi:hypothetical protein
VNDAATMQGISWGNLVRVNFLHFDPKTDDYDAHLKPIQHFHTAAGYQYWRVTEREVIVNSY